ncbi:tyrosine-type recombinase/integrase [Actinacidiphila oryziradicis]|uniref:Site-specific integrase n=1 Tax=Actinacidiphila oryziradicis TaxID=2571141 RepID=A0A4U0RIF7_9ACTN|nr:site-specific integrase [Actinacidiphila oryziradicis]TJZ94956.1 site-specific integrase [Actinacidiphila oryziradicis]
MFDTWQEARDHLDEVRVAMRTNAWVDPDIGNRTVESYANEMIERRRKKKKNNNTTKNYASHIRCHIIPFAGKRAAQTLKRRDTMAFVDFLMERPGIDEASTVVQVFKTWRLLMNYMIDEDVPLPGNIVSRIDLPEVTERESVALTPEQVAALAAAMREVEPRWEILVWIGACAGLREGEAFGLKRSAVAWQNDLIYIEEQRQEGKAAGLKTKASYATLPVDHFLIERLAEHIARYPQVPPVSEDRERERRRMGYQVPPDESLIVTNRYGRPMRGSAFNVKWRTAVERAGLPSGTRFHALKHFYTTRLGASGHDPKTVQALSRHAEFSETWDTYAHPPLAVEGITVRAFGALFASADGERTAA